MTLIRRNENYPAWSNLLNDFINHDWIDWSNRNFSVTNTTLPSVNIKEGVEDFEVEMENIIRKKGRDRKQRK